MKLLLICFNVVLAVVLGYSVVGYFRDSKAVEPVRAVAGGRRAADAKPVVPEATDDEERTMAERIVSADIFNSSRLPDAATLHGGRVELLLVGTFTIGDIQGAVVRQRTITRQVNPFMQMMRPGGMGENNPAPPPAGGRSALFRQRFSAGIGMPGSNSGALKQYVRVGETISNGYTLAEVSRDRAIFTRGSDRLELELLPPSRSAAAGSSSGPRRLNVNQQLQQAQIQTQQMMMRMMMQMQRNQQSGNAPRNTGPQRNTGNRGAARSGR